MTPNKHQQDSKYWNDSNPCNIEPPLKTESTPDWLHLVAVSSQHNVIGAHPPQDDVLPLPQLDQTILLQEL